MKHAAVESFFDADGDRHELVVRESADGDWRVLDINLVARVARVIETLSGGEDGRPQAEAIALDYLSTVEDTTPTAGRRSRDPINENPISPPCSLSPILSTRHTVIDGPLRRDKLSPRM